MTASEVCRARVGAPLRVAIASPFVWPYVRRGSERLLNDLAAYLHAAGAKVEVFAMAPCAGEEDRDGVRYHLLRERCRTTLRQFNSLHWFAWRLQAALRDALPDVVFCLSYFDAYAAVQARRRHGLCYRVIFQNVGIPIRSYFRAVPIDRWLMGRVLHDADQLLVLSHFAQDTLMRDFGVDAQVLPPPVYTERFVGQFPDSTPPDVPTLLFVGDVEEPRKGAQVLCEAFARLKPEWPTLRLHFVGNVRVETQRRLRETPMPASHQDDICFFGVGDIGGLPAHFQAASVTVLPAVWEAFGLVLVESLAAGTPVVGARHGGISDVIQGEMIGALFEPGVFRHECLAVDALVNALRPVLLRGKTATVQAACRARAQSFSWRALGPRYLQIVETVRAAPMHMRATPEAV